MPKYYWVRFASEVARLTGPRRSVTLPAASQRDVKGPHGVYGQATAAGS